MLFPNETLMTTWEVPVLVLGSLLIQVALIPMGYYRKYISNRWLRWFLWLFYLTADSITTGSLSILSNYRYERLSEPIFVIRAVWAPFLLLHMGGPDTITAFSMQDNDLWLRHFLILFLQAGIAFYVYFRALKPTALNFIAIPIFVSGIIKYCERTWTFRSASIDHLRDQIVPTNDDCLSIFRVPDTQHRLQEVQNLHAAYGFFLRNKWVFADLILSPGDFIESRSYFEGYTYETAYKVVEIELGFMHDFFYTKASLIHSSWGALLRLVTISTTLIAIVTFCTTDKHIYPRADVCLTLVLLFGALGVELFSIVLLMRSDWFVIWLTQINNSLARFTFRVVACGLGRWSIEKRRWSNSVPQYNLITHCIQDINDARCWKYRKFLRISKYTNIMDSQPVSDELKDRIFQWMKYKAGLRNDARLCLANHVKENLNTILATHPQCDQRILVWHIATDVCFHIDYAGNENTRLRPLMKDMKLLSEYLAYLLMSRHSLFPNGMSRMRINDTIEKCITYFNDNNIERDEQAYENIRRYEPPEPNSTVFHFGCEILNFVQGLERADVRWDLIKVMWMEIVCDICIECRMKDHIEELGHGGDFLTHAWLLMHHLGYPKQTYNVLTPEQQTELANYADRVVNVINREID